MDPAPPSRTIHGAAPLSSDAFLSEGPAPKLRAHVYSGSRKEGYDRAHPGDETEAWPLGKALS